MIGFDHVGPSHGGNPSPTVRGGEEVPVAQHVAGHRIGDVVGGEREPVDLEQDLPVGQRREGPKVLSEDEWKWPTAPIRVTLVRPLPDRR